MENKAIRGLALQNRIRIYAANTTTIIDGICNTNKTSPCASAALGRSLSILVLMGLMNKEDEVISLTIAGDGPLGNIHGQYLGNGVVRGYVDNPDVPILINDKNKLDVKGVVGTEGTLTIIKKSDVKVDYYGTSPLVSGEISEDFTYYFASSEQTPSVVSAGVLVDKDLSIASSGAIIIQLMPDATDEDIDYIERLLPMLANISSELKVNNDILAYIKSLFPDFNLLDEQVISYECLCSYDEMRSKIMMLGVDDLTIIKEEDQNIEAVCPWCSSIYNFNEDDIQIIIDDITMQTMQ